MLPFGTLIIHTQYLPGKLEANSMYPLLSVKVMLQTAIQNKKNNHNNTAITIKYKHNFQSVRIYEH